MIDNIHLQNDHSYPRDINKVSVPPIKCQGIKTKLVKFILSNIKWNGDGIWYDPFMGSGVVSFNAIPKKSILSDINPHIIQFYKDIQDKKMTPKIVRDFLEFHGKKLSETDDSADSYYYEMRDIFNETYGSFYFLFLIRSCFNGLMRFNSKGKYNASFCKKPNRFSKAYITKIVNQIKWVQKVITENDYTFICSHWKDILEGLSEKDFVYCDPPYIGRHTTYYDKWNDDDEKKLLNWTKESPCGWAISSWYKNKYRENTFIQKAYSDHTIRTNEHYYFLGSNESLRTNMTEALIIKKEYATEDPRIIYNYMSTYKS